MTNLQEQAPALDLALLHSLDFTPSFTCEDSGHGDVPAPAVWRVRKRHTAAGCDVEQETLLCDDHLRALQRLSNVFVICIHCMHGAYARDWWRLAGGV